MSDWRDHWEAILTDIAGGDTLRNTCRLRNINHTTILQALVQDTEDGRALADQYARARIGQAHSFADDIIAEGEREGVLGGKHGTVDPGEVALRKLRTENKKWLLARLHPKVYGDRVDVTSGGEKLGPIAMLPPELLVRPSKDAG